jgi:aldehyde dehydrogenase
MGRHAAPGQNGAKMAYESRYDHWIGGEYVKPQRGRYFENPTPVTGHTFTEIARGTAEDVERTLDAAHGAAPAWGRTPAAERANDLNKIADRMEQHLEALAVAETWRTASRSARHSPRTSPWRSTTSGTSPAPSTPRKARCR